MSLVRSYKDETNKTKKTEKKNGTLHWTARCAGKEVGGEGGKIPENVPRKTVKCATVAKPLCAFIKTVQHTELHLCYLRLPYAPWQYF